MSRSFTKRKRVAEALNHREPDRVPCDITIAPLAYQALCDVLGEKFEPYVWDDWSHTTPSVAVLEKLDVDVYHVDLGTAPKGFHCEEDIEFTDVWGNKKRKVFNASGGFNYCFVDSPLANAETDGDVEAWKWPEPEEIVQLTDHHIAEIKHLYNHTDFALTATFGGSIEDRSRNLIGLDTWLMNLYDNPEINCKVMDKIMGIQMRVDEIVIEKIGKYLTYFRFNGDDVGTQSGPLYDPEMFRKYTRPRLENEWRRGKELYLKQNPDGKIAVHSCGSIKRFIPQFIEMGADMLNPVQSNAAEMDTAVLKREFGERISFHGSVNTQEVLEKGTPKDVREEIHTRILDLGKNGGLIIAPSHHIQDSVPIENVLEMYAAIKEYGIYPLDLKGS